ncbi:TetR family transcriptional regulator [Streptomyces sp. 3MP-14]|uniref:TetR family transcriptional regulator n=1 Tax=Streptomyces mimosae TaxID=2586635 RepID=A0A5N6A0R9_9ACTN|nr:MULTISPECIES: TetR/AcrR family transcriptional regulator [Streptomyces]KAB8161260.1 TetR family transcriptional regulator [Streptomyces mimosae]KAB8173062.1 TetR family transcriptional regulator [Streptomyces sp. 3MP-14]
MPKQVDYAERRERVVDAVHRLADRHGLEGVTLRDVAREAGLSMGAVQRGFRDKDEMLALALARVGERFVARARAAATKPSPAALARVLADLALLAEEQRPEAQVWLAFVARAAVTPSLAGTLRADHPEVLDLLTRLVAEVTEARGVAVDPAAEARALLALTDGLTVQLLLGQLDRAEARGVLDAQLRRLCGTGG